jgi:predicted ATPase
MESSVFIERVRAKNFKSIARCDVQLGALTYLVGPNGTGKSNFLDILHFVKDALEGSLENALQTRGGLSEVRRRSGGHPTNFGVDLSFVLPDKRRGRYSFEIAAKTSGGFAAHASMFAKGASSRTLSLCFRRSHLTGSP